MSLVNELPIYTIGRGKGDFMLQCFRWKGKTQFTYQFTVALRRNNDFPQCNENKALDTKQKLLFLGKGRQLFDKVLTGCGYNLNTFTGWRRSGITRFTLRTTAINADPGLIIEDDPSTIQYHSVSDFQHQFNNLLTLPLIDDLDTKHARRLGSYRYVSLIAITNAHYSLVDARYVRKSIDEEHPETLKDWENEFVLLTRLQECPYTVDLAGVTRSRNPYSPSGEDVVTAFLLEYGKRGTLQDFIGKVDEVPLLEWMLQVAKGLREMHRHGIIDRDLKPDNIIITESRKAKIIDLAQSGFTPQYSAPEFRELFNRKDQWPSSVDIYSYGVVYWVLLSGRTDGLPELSFTNMSPIRGLIAQCVAINPLRRPAAEDIIDVLEHLPL